jgi:hypothetical protein
MRDSKTGSCLCGRVQFSVTGRLRDVIACHCRQCRKQSGHHYAATNVRNDGLEIKDDGALKWYRSSERASRGFCSECGSALFWKHDGEENTSILAGSFEEPTGLRLTSHIFVADKGDYYDIGDGLPQYPKYPPSVKAAE